MFEAPKSALDLLKNERDQYKFHCSVHEEEIDSLIEQLTRVSIKAKKAKDVLNDIEKTIALLEQTIVVKNGEQDAKG